MIFSSKRPISFYLFTYGNLAFCGYIGYKSKSISSAVLYGTILYAVGYLLFLRGHHFFQLYSHKIILEKCYKKKFLHFDKIVSFDYYRNYWHLLPSLSRLSNSLTDRPYDVLFIEVIIDNKNEILELHLNLLIFQFSKLIKSLKKVAINHRISDEMKQTARVIKFEDLQ